MQVANNNKGNGFEKGVFKTIFLILAWLIIISLAKDALNIRKGFDRVKEAQARLAEEEHKNGELTKKYDMVRTDEYREKLIREQLNMQKEGEVIAVLPKKGGGLSVPKNDVSKEVPIWKKWLNLID